MRFHELTEAVIGAAIEVHRHLGPGLLESTYEECLCRELELRHVGYRRQVPLPVHYKGMQLECGYRIDVLVEERLILELKTVERTLPIHDAQLLTYLKLTNLTLGLLLNFSVPVMKDGIKRIANNFQDDKRTVSPPPPDNEHSNPNQKSRGATLYTKTNLIKPSAPRRLSGENNTFSLSPKL